MCIISVVSDGLLENCDVLYAAVSHNGPTFSILYTLLLYTQRDFITILYTRAMIVFWLLIITPHDVIII